MTVVKDALVVRLRTVLTTLGDYQGQKRIFAADKVPGDCPRPYVTLYGPVTAREFETKTGPTGSEDPEAGAGHVLQFDLGVYGDANGDPSVVDDLALLAQRGINRKPSELTVTGWHVMIAKAQVGVVAPTDESIYGRVVNIELTLRPR